MAGPPRACIDRHWLVRAPPYGVRVSGPIEVKVFSVVLSPDGKRHLVWRGRDSSKTPENFHRLLGGHVEFGETLVDAIVREIAEELDVAFLQPYLLGALENIFTFEGQPGHEIVFVFGGDTGDQEPVPPAGAWRDDGGPIWVEWRPVEPSASEIPLHPTGAQAFVEEATRNAHVSDATKADPASL
jgi:ADP-ribose pyrophosphatase YjhB (NUDIX family)